MAKKKGRRTRSRGLSPAELDILAAELNTDPLNRGYSDMNDQQASEDLNDDYRDYSKSIEVSEFEQAMRVSTKWIQFRERQDAREANGTTRTYPAIAELMDAFQSRIPECDLRVHPNRQNKESVPTYWSTLLDACVAEGSIGADAAEQAKALCDTTITRARELVDVNVTAYDVERARAR